MHDRRGTADRTWRASLGRGLWRCVALSLVAASLASYAYTDVQGQSSNPSAPTPLTSERLANRIEPRDIGDARATTHFYTFEARPGDLELQVVSENLNGDVDLFAADDLRPLTKVTLLASPVPKRVARTIFLREGATLTLRVVARSPGDEAGTYEVTFGGTFQASTRPAVDEAGTATVAAATSPQPASPTTGAPPARRVTSSGARIEEELAANVPAARVPVLPESVTANDETASPVAVPTKTPRVPSASRAARRRGARPPRPPRANTRPPVAANDDTTVATTTNDDEVAVPPTVARPTPSPARARRLARRPPAASRLVIRTREGERIERLMIDVERVVVEGGELIVRLKSGEERRLSLADVARFAIEP